MQYSSNITVPFRMCDPAGVLFFGNYLALAHDVLEQCITKSSIGWQEWFASKEFLFPIRKAEVDYFRPLWAGANVLAQLEVISVGTTSVQLVVHLLVSGNEALGCGAVPDAPALARPNAEIKLTVVCVDQRSLKATAWPDTFRLALTPNVTDQRHRP